MSTTISLKESVRNEQADLVARDCDSGYIKIYAGTPPATVDTALSGNTLLAELTFSATSAPAASGGQLTFSTITGDSSNNATGTATFYRTFQSDGTTVVFQGTIGTSGESMTLADTSLVAGGTTDVTSFTYSVP